MQRESYRQAASGAKQKPRLPRPDRRPPRRAAPQRRARVYAIDVHLERIRVVAQAQHTREQHTSDELRSRGVSVLDLTEELLG